MHISTIDYNAISGFLFGYFDFENAEKIIEKFFKLYF